MLGGFRHKSIISVLWSSLDRFGQQIVQFVTSVILARILLPAEFGLIAMLSIFIAFGNSFIDSGFQKALIQKKELTQIDESSVFYLNVFISLLIASTMTMMAPLIADFFGQPKLIQITRVLSLTLIFSSLGLVQDALLARCLKFKVLFKVNLSANVISGLVSIYLAISGYGVWSIVFLQVGSSLFRTVFLWVFNTWRPGLYFSVNSIKSMFSFGSRLLVVSLTNSIFTNLYQVIIGKLFSAGDLGFYSRAKNLSMYPVTTVTGVINQVSFPVFSKIQDKPEQLRSLIAKALTLLTLVTFPLMIGVAVTAKPLITILLTEKWLPAVPYFQLLCAIGIMYPIQVINLNALNARGRSDLYLKIDVINKILIVGTVMITFRFGIIAMIYGQIINGIAAYYLYAYYTGKHIGYSIFAQIKDMLPAFVLSLLMGFAMKSVSYFIFEGVWLLLISQILFGIFIYFGTCYLFKVPAFLNGISIIKENLYKQTESAEVLS